MPAISRITIMKIRKCKHCQEEFDISDKSKGWMANHSRWCDKNPKRNDYSNNMEKARAAKVNFINQYTKARLEGITIPDSPNKGKPGTFLGREHSKETKELMRKKALESPHRRLRKGMVEYNGVMLDSSWELALAKRLDELEIKWERPEPLKWIDQDGLIHNYFPDFYLPDYDIYLDPKNPRAAEVQKKKIDILKSTYHNLIFINDLTECKTFMP